MSRNGHGYGPQNRMFTHMFALADKFFEYCSKYFDSVDKVENSRSTSEMKQQDKAYSFVSSRNAWNPPSLQLTQHSQLIT